MAGDRAENIGNRVENRKRKNAGKSAITQIFQLPAQNGIVGTVVVEHQGSGAQQIHRDEEGDHQAIEQPAHLNQSSMKLKDTGGRAHHQSEKNSSRHIEQKSAETGPDDAAGVGKSEAEMKKQRRREQACSDVAPINDLVEIIQLPGVMEA